MKESLKQFLDYWNSDEEFTYLLRMKGFIWIDKEYFRMLDLIRKVLIDYYDDEFISKTLVFFFGCQLPRLIETISHPSFLLNPPAPYSEKEYTDLIEQRKNELLKMQENFFCGRYKEI